MDALARILATKAEEIAAAKATTPLAELRAQVRDAAPVRPFAAALARSSHPVSLIAEVKKASPSRGLIRSDFDAEAIARAYELAGADALSILTDSNYFQGSADNLRRARGATRLPCLRKDFIVDAYQVYEARAWGADAVLLIVAALDRHLLEGLRGLAEELGMDALVEVHREEELDAALAAEATIIGVNNRDLGDFKTDLANAERLIPMIEGRALAVAESAIENHVDVSRMEAVGARSVLIGTTFCAAPDLGAKVREVMGW